MKDYRLMALAEAHRQLTILIKSGAKSETAKSLRRELERMIREWSK